MLISNSEITYELQHFVIKMVHNLFLQNDLVKSSLLANGLIKLLCDLFYPEFEKKKKFLKQNSNDIEDIRKSFFHKIIPDKFWKIEEDILSFLKSIALYGCMNNSGISLLEDILLVIIIYHC